MPIDRAETYLPDQTSNPEADHEHVIAALSEDLHVPVQNVSAVYWEQLRKLAAGARIRSFLSLLATGRTRSILRDRVHAPPRDRVRDRDTPRHPTT